MSLKQFVGVLIVGLFLCTISCLAASPPSRKHIIKVFVAPQSPGVYHQVCVHWMLNICHHNSTLLKQIDLQSKSGGSLSQPTSVDYIKKSVANIIYQSLEVCNKMGKRVVYTFVHKIHMTSYLLCAFKFFLYFYLIWFYLTFLTFQNFEMACIYVLSSIYLFIFTF